MTTSKAITVKNKLGVHARVASQIAACAKNANSKIWIVKDNEKIDATSIIDILTIECHFNTSLTLLADSESDITILNKVEKIINVMSEEELINE